MTAEEWNRKYKVGTVIKYYPWLGPNSSAEISKTRSEAWELGNGDAVVLIEGRSGGVALRNVEVLDGKLL